MTEREAYQILGLPADAGPEHIRKRYRELIIKVHPDTFQNKPSEVKEVEYSARSRSSADGPQAHGEPVVAVSDAAKLNLAYSVLTRGKKASISDPGKTAADSTGQAMHPESGHAPGTTYGRWDAPCNPHAFREREVYCRAEDAQGEVIGVFPIAKGKYIWTPDEDFSLFLKSIYQCSQRILAEAERDLHMQGYGSAAHMQALASVSYLLAQQFIDAHIALHELAKEITEEGSDKDQMTASIWHVPAMLEPGQGALLHKGRSLIDGDMLYPAAVRDHRLYLKDRSGQEHGYLSFQDDRLYYVIVPLFEQHHVQVKIRVSDRQPIQRKGRHSAFYRNIDLFLRFDAASGFLPPENLNLQIEEALGEYRKALIS